MELPEIQKSIEQKPTQQNYELIWAHFFISRLNKEKNFDYEVEEGPNDLTDVYAKSKSGEYPLLRLQLTYEAGKDWKSGKDKFKDPMKALKKLIRLPPRFSLKNILNTVHEKYSKYKCQSERGIAGRTADDIKQTILLIQGELPRGWEDILMNDEIMKSKIVSYPFQGIYYVTPPGLRSDGKEVVEDYGFSLTFKDAFPIN